MSQASTLKTNGDTPSENEDRAPTTRRSARGFARLDAEQRRQISSVGGKAAHAKGRGHEFTTEEARAAGHKGGLASAAAARSRKLPARSEKTLPRLVVNELERDKQS